MLWYQDSRWRNRLVAEQELMRSRFPQFQLRRSSSGDLRWAGWLEPVPSHLFMVSIHYPGRYPYERPRLFVDDPAIAAEAPHLYADHSLCVHSQQWDPQTGTAITCVPLASAWLARYVAWLNGQEF